MGDCDCDCATGEQETKRALILAGGGLKVAFQAGALQVLLDEAELDFPIADGTSGGTFNLAMYCQGMSGTQIADNWRSFSPSSGIAPNLPGALLGPFGPGLFSFRRYAGADGVFDAWGLDFEAINASGIDASFNLYDFQANELVPVPAEALDRRRLTACNSLAFWFPPVTIDDRPHLDAVYVTDANIERAIDAGANDIVVIWTISRRGRWRHGFWQQYFQAIEEGANGTFKRISARIEANNAAIEAGRCGQYGRKITLRVLAAEVPLNYIFNFRRDRMAAAVEQGVREARAFCEQERLMPEVTPPAAATPPMPPADPGSPGLSFRDSMRGAIVPEKTPAGASGPDAKHPLDLELSVEISEIDRFVTDPEHEAYIGGHLVSEHLGGRCLIEQGRLNLLSFTRDPGDARMHYVLKFRDRRTKEPMTLIGDKFVVKQRGSSMWADTTTMFFAIWPGHLDDQPSDAQPLGRGQVRVSPLDFLRQQLSMKAQVQGFPDTRVAVIARFYAYFLGRLFDVYGQKVLPWSPF
jgi:predicted acylesterase/phospholipase RssA